MPLLQMPLLPLLLLLLLAAPRALAHRISKSCASTCDFRLCSEAKLSLLSEPFKAATPPICLEGRPVHVTSSGEAFVRSGASYYSQISRKRTARGAKPCAPNFFTTFPTESGAAAVGFQPSPDTDYSFLAGKCVSLPLNTVQLVTPSGEVLYEMQLEGRPLKDCVGFQVDEHVPPPLPPAPHYEAPPAPAAPAAAAAATADDDVSHGGRSALDARKSIMQSLGGGAAAAAATREPASALAVAGAAAAPSAEPDEELEPEPSAEALPEQSAEPPVEQSAEPSWEPAADDERALAEAAPLLVFGA